MRNPSAVFAFALSFALASASAAAPVGVAVVGFSGGEPAQLRSLATHVRSELAAHADPAVMTVVSREAMTRVYTERGATCSPGDTDCIVDASSGWGGRLFVRGATAPGPDGVIVTAALESVRGIRVAATSAQVATLADAPAIAPLLVHELLAQERTYRATMSARAPANTPRLTDVSDVSDVSDVRDASETSDLCHGWLVGPVPRQGDLVFDAARVDWRVTGWMGKEWGYDWSDMRTIEPLFTSNYKPGISLTPASTMDFVIVFFDNDDQRDRCYRSLLRARDASR